MKIKSLIALSISLLAFSCSDNDFINEDDSVSNTEQLKACYLKDNLWKTGELIVFKYDNSGPYNCNDDYKTVFNDACQEWMRWANVYFKIAPSNYQGKCISLKFQNRGDKMISGTNGIGTNADTMHFQGLNLLNDEQVKGTILHELGHLLGRIHEHQNPAADFQWNHDVALAWWKNLRGGKHTDDWWEKDFSENITKKPENPFFTAYDENSIMTYEIPAKCTYNGKTSHKNYELSTLDIQSAMTVYPMGNRERLYRYNINGQHFYTFTYTERGIKNLEAAIGRVYFKQIEGTVPFYRLYNKKTGGYLSTINYAEVETLLKESNWQYQGYHGYVYGYAATGSIPLYRYFKGKNNDHFYTTNYNELGAGKDGYTYEGIACWILPPYGD